MSSFMAPLTVIGICLILSAIIILQRHILVSKETNWKFVLRRLCRFIVKVSKGGYKRARLLFIKKNYLDKLNDEALLSVLFELIEVGRYKKAEPYLIQLLAKQNDMASHEIPEKLALIYFETKRYKKALLILEQALQKHPKQASLYAWYGRVLYQFGKESEAKKVMKHAIDLGGNPQIRLWYNEICSY